MEHNGWRNGTRAFVRRTRWMAYTVAAVLVGASAVFAFVVAQGPGDAAATRTPGDVLLGAGIRGDAGTLDLADYSGQVVVVNFMAGWCVSCWAEIPAFVALFEQGRQDDLVVIAISLRTSEAQTQEMIARLGIPYPVYLDEDAGVSLGRFGLRTMPTTIVFDRQGSQAHRFDGPVTPNALRSAVDATL